MIGHNRAKDFRKSCCKCYAPLISWTILGTFMYTTTAVYCQNRSSKDISWIRRCIEMQISLIVSYWLYLVALRSKSVDISMYYIPEQCFLGLLNINYFFLLNLPNYVLTIPDHVVFIFNSIQHVLNLHDCFTLP